MSTRSKNWKTELLASTSSPYSCTTFQENYVEHAIRADVRHALKDGALGEKRGNDQAEV